MRFSKQYGQSRNDGCAFCDRRALAENRQGLPTCEEHKSRVMVDKRCACGEYLDIKKSKWGAFFLCSNCGPISLKKASELTGGDYHLNKKFRRENKVEYAADKVYTIDELEAMWEDKKPL